MNKKDYELAYEYIYYLLKLDEDSMSFPLVIDSLEVLKELVDQTKTPTEEEIIKEWEALGFQWVEQRKNTQLEIHLLSSCSEIIIYTKSKMYECIDRETDCIVQPLTFQEHQLLTKTFKMLGWDKESSNGN